MRVVLLLDTVLECFKTGQIIVRSSLIDNKMLILYKEEIFRNLSELNFYLQNQDMNIVRTKQIIKAFMNKLAIWKMKAMMHDFCHFPS